MMITTTVIVMMMTITMMVIVYGKKDDGEHDDGNAPVKLLVLPRTITPKAFGQFLVDIGGLLWHSFR